MTQMLCYPWITTMVTPLRQIQTPQISRHPTSLPNLRPPLNNLCTRLTPIHLIPFRVLFRPIRTPAGFPLRLPWHSQHPRQIAAVSTACYMVRPRLGNHRCEIHIFQPPLWRPRHSSLPHHTIFGSPDSFPYRRLPYQIRCLQTPP